MIENLNIKNFGSYKEFEWTNSIPNNQMFKKLNIFYGINYSGKTTLSRIFEALETGEFSQYFNDPDFEVFAQGTSYTHNSIPATNLNLRVYNKDFVKRNLNFLYDQSGHIEPIAIIGEENVDLIKKIKDLKGVLGSIEEKKGIEFEYDELVRSAILKRAEIKSKEEKLRQKLSKKASDIKNDLTYEAVTYDIGRIKNDIQKVIKDKLIILTSKELETNRNAIKEKILPNISLMDDIEFKIEFLSNNVNSICKNKIIPSKPIQELINDSVLSAWVKEGMNIHKTQRSKCGFCGNPIPLELWGELEGHFDKKSEEFNNLIEDKIQDIGNEKKNIQNLFLKSKEEFYISNQNKYSETLVDIEKSIKEYIFSLDELIFCLNEKLNKLFSVYEIALKNHSSGNLSDCILQLNALIIENNADSQHVEKNKNVSLEKLRLNEVLKFISDISLSDIEKEISQFESEFKSISSQKEVQKSLLDQSKIDLDKLKAELVDEKIGAEKINSYLSHFFGHRELNLVVFKEDEEKDFKFRVMRKKTPAYELSEGECSLIAFCYFVAKIQADIASQIKPLIFIDDPISSLDSNHIFFVYSIIAGIIAKNEQDDQGQIIYNYSQLFITTHNLEFLKYLKNINRHDGEVQQFLLTSGITGSKLELMPKYLKKYITEFNYLFNEICICSKEENITKYLNSFYNFGNNFRKFLEAYLFFKYPYDEGRNDYNNRIKLFFGEDDVSGPYVQRMTNEYSHLGNIIDRGMVPIDSKEISALSIFLLTKIKSNDEIQYQSLLKSVDKEDPVNT